MSYWFKALDNYIPRYLNIFRYFAVVLLKMPRWGKKAIAISVDASLCGFTLWLALLLRYGYIKDFEGEAVIAFFYSTALSIALFQFFGLYRVVFRYSGWYAVGRIMQAITVYGFFFALLTIFFRFEGVPRTVGIIQPILMFFFVAGSRLLVRWFLGDGYKANGRIVNQTRVVIYGAGSAGRQLARALARQPTIKVVFFVDDDVRLQGSWVNDLKILAAQHIETLVLSRRVDEVLLAMPSVDAERRKTILEKLSLLGTPVRTLPSLLDLASGRVAVTDLRPLQINDILAREPVPPMPALMNKHVKGQVILVTGAGGSIGAELCRQIAKYTPGALVLVDHAEPCLYHIHMELCEAYPDLEIVPCLASISDIEKMRSLLDNWRVNIIYHAAAYKHVPMVEQNIQAGIKNNGLGTWQLAQLANEQHVERFVLVSSDKAVRPTNVMGATKRMSEIALQCLAESGSTTTFCMVRFGNVLGSSGSVVPLFEKQIRAGGPVTLTHERVTRYFMTIPEAAQLVIQAGAMSLGGEVFVLDMGERVRIKDLAKRMIQLSGGKVKDENNPDGDIEIRITGLRPGEKLYEELLIGDGAQSTSHPRIMKANEECMPINVFEEAVRLLINAVDSNDVVAMREQLKTIVPEFSDKTAG